METESKPPPEQRSSNPTPSSYKILVVEDNLTNQKVIVRQLESLGYEADVVSDGQAALEATAQCFYPIILMDYRLPGINGYEATRLIRQHEQKIGNVQKAIIIALTANDDPQAQTAATVAGMNDFLNKPLRRDTLAATLEHWVKILDKTAAKDAQKLSNVSDNNRSLSNLFSTDYLAALELHFDLVQLHQLSDHNLEFEQELLKLYFDDTCDQIQQLQQAISRQSLQQIERIAHHVKGASASVGAKRLEQLAEALEQQAKQKQLEIATDLFLQLKQTFEQIRGLF